MILTIDVGNTTTAIGLFDSAGKLTALSSLGTEPRKTRDQFAMDLQGVFRLYGADIQAVDGSIVSCVVPPLEGSLLDAVELLTGCRPLVVGPGVKTGMNIRSDLHNQLGSDIVASSVAALARYPSPIIAIDLGTATTFSLLCDGVYEGCAILPGVRLGLEALSEHTAALPRISLPPGAGGPPPDPLGHNTVDAMRAGVIYGNAGMVDSMIDRFARACHEPVQTIVATGGNAPFVLPHCTHAIIHDPTLLQDGLYLLYQKNAERRQTGRRGSPTSAPRPSGRA